jgi:N-acetyl-gamma-glutamyl-phosphate reductase
MGARTAVIGASGYAGGELLRLLAAHPVLEVGPLVAGGNAGRTVGDVHPHLTTISELPLLSPATADLDGVEVVFVAMPSGASAAVVDTLPADAIVVDLGGDHRLAEAEDWARWYSGPHAGCWPYGLPELPGARAALSDARRVANPGCYATAVCLGLVPLLHERLVELSDLVVVAASGTTGAGRAPAVNLLASEVMGDITTYRVGGAHQHLGELRQVLGRSAGDSVSISFTPMLIPAPRGILATCTASVRPGVRESQLRDAFASYGAEPFVTVLPAGRWPHTAATVGSNSAHIQVAYDTDAGRAVVVVALDNLGKGAAGQAIQNANLQLGLDETSGLAIDGLAP